MKTLKIITGLVSFALLVWFLAGHQPLIRANVTARDSIAYWAAARLLRRGSVTEYMLNTAPAEFLHLRRSGGSYLWFARAWDA